LRLSTGFQHAIEVTSCTPQDSMWSWPSEETADGLLARVLSTGKLRVAGVQWTHPGGAADYTTNPSAPTGFWPEYMSAIAKSMSTHYGKQIDVERVYYETSDLVTKAVAEGIEVEMSEPYYYLGGFYDDKPRIEALHFSCITVAVASAFSSTEASGIKSMDDLYEKISQGPIRKIGFIGEGNYDSVSHLLPANVDPVYEREQTNLDDLLDGGIILAYYISESGGPSSASAGRVIYETGVISPRVALFRPDSQDECVHSNALKAVQEGDECVDTSFLYMILIILASVVFLMTCLLGILICKERRGKPVFMAPLKDVPGNGQVYGSSM